MFESPSRYEKAPSIVIDGAFVLVLMPTHSVYILFSERANLYYVGNTDLDPQVRLAQHNEGVHPRAATKRGIPWKIVLVMECDSRLQARRIETHIKRMKSRTYIENLLRYPEMRDKLRRRYA